MCNSYELISLPILMGQSRRKKNSFEINSHFTRDDCAMFAFTCSREEKTIAVSAERS